MVDREHRIPSRQQCRSNQPNGVLLFVLLGLVSCSMAPNRQGDHQRVLPVNQLVDSRRSSQLTPEDEESVLSAIKPLHVSKKIARLTPDEQLVVRYILTRLFENKKKEAEAQGKTCTCYVRVSGKNPDPAAIADLQGERIKLKPASAGMLRGFWIFDPEVDWARS